MVVDAKPSKPLKPGESRRYRGYTIARSTPTARARTYWVEKEGLFYSHAVNEKDAERIVDEREG